MVFHEVRGRFSLSVHVELIIQCVLLFQQTLIAHLLVALTVYLTESSYVKEKALIFLCLSAENQIQIPKNHPMINV